MKILKPAQVLTLKSLFIGQCLCALALTLFVHAIWGLRPSASFVLGYGMMLANLVLLAWIWGRILSKKPIAWTVMIIVIKYTVLLGAIYLMSQAAWFHVVSAGLGMAAFAGGSLVQVAFYQRGVDSIGSSAL